ncbi:MAG: hypothetical protein ACLQMS_19680, partial [Desulfomonilaceae bacterium]
CFSCPKPQVRIEHNVGAVGEVQFHKLPQEGPTDKTNSPFIVTFAGGSLGKTFFQNSAGRLVSAR